MFSGLFTRMEILTLRTSAGRHGQPCMAGEGVEGNWNLCPTVSFDPLSRHTGLLICLPLEVRSVSVSIQDGRPENIGKVFGVVKISQSTSEISQVPTSFDAIPDIEGCPYLPMEVRSVSVSIQVGSPENIRNSFGIVKISQSTSDISQLPVSFDACSRRMGLPRSAKGNSYGQSHYSTRQPENIYLL